MNPNHSIVHTRPKNQTPLLNALSIPKPHPTCSHVTPIAYFKWMPNVCPNPKTGQTPPSTASSVTDWFPLPSLPAEIRVLGLRDFGNGVSGLRVFRFLRVQGLGFRVGTMMTRAGTVLDLGCGAWANVYSNLTVFGPKYLNCINIRDPLYFLGVWGSIYFCRKDSFPSYGHVV